MKPEYKETYRGITFHKTRNGFWLFNESVPNNPGSYWSRYATNNELRLIGNPKADIKVVAKIMRAMIDRALEGHVVYRGDIREWL